MTCINLPNCSILEKISSVMPHTTKMVKQSCCLDKKRCVKDKLAKIIIVIDEDDELPDEK